ncbi:MAG TPA: hypothetical protein VFR80_00375 [Pyrinomonadaceae bacterium]|nr:hypothetical protein [Pyrinomonadaceae bacterium]
MKQVDMSATAVTARLQRIAQLRRLCLSLQKAKLPTREAQVKIDDQQGEASKPKVRMSK